ncbi:hypothetical protein [Vreelandella maris]|mgnify:CR=1 FL=1|uniref:Uncharacterized protein n=1 Tax=Vreelandella maris TaxID=2729617 RepID=A0A7Y6RB69_9GAMM|nr:hypothetical protein [Halomonas maris]NVF13750.1 hypothetical protein [Halomonas maris]|tara:strand:- start:8197 stop:9294 length:1098 start_codon:yes stop_codon:yes gene_type:complete
MDDNLTAITNDLNSVIDRLTEYMNSDETTSQVGHPRECFVEDAARVILMYAESKTSHDASELFECIEAAHSMRIDMLTLYSGQYPDGSRLCERLPEGASPSLIGLMSALRAIYDWGEGMYWPLERAHMQVLYKVISAWSDKEGQFIGENEGLQLTPKRNIDRKITDRTKAAWDAVNLHLADPKKYPVDENLFEISGKPYGMSSSVVKRFYYSKEFKECREIYSKVSGHMLLDESEAERILKNAFDDLNLSQDSFENIDSKVLNNLGLLEYAADIKEEMVAIASDPILDDERRKKKLSELFDRHGVSLDEFMNETSKALGELGLTLDEIRQPFVEQLSITPEDFEKSLRELYDSDPEFREILKRQS